MAADDHHLLLYDYVQDMADRRGPYREAHLGRIRAGQDEGRIVMAGALGDPPHGAAIVFKSNRRGPLPGTQFWLVDRNGDGLRQLGHSVSGEADNAAAWGPR